MSSIIPTSNLSLTFTVPPYYLSMEQMRGKPIEEIWFQYSSLYQQKNMMEAQAGHLALELINTKKENEVLLHQLSEMAGLKKLVEKIIRDNDNLVTELSTMKENMTEITKNNENLSKEVKNLQESNLNMEKRMQDQMWTLLKLAFYPRIF